MNAPVVTPDGWSLAIERRPAVGTRRAVAILGHAMFVSRRTLHKLAAALTEDGVECWLVDLRGHGDSAPAATGGDWTYADIVCRDIPAVAQAVAERTGERPIWIGHSLAAHGGLFAWGLRPDLPLQGLVSLGGNLWMSRFVPDRLVWLQRQLTLEAWRGVTRAAGYFPVRRLGLGTDDEARSYVDELVRIALSDRVVLDGQDALGPLSRLAAPVLSVTSVGDTWMCTPDAARRFLGHAGRARVVHRVVGERPGDPGAAGDVRRGVDHMGLVLDARMRPVFGDIAAFVVDVAAGRRAACAP